VPVPTPDVVRSVLLIVTVPVMVPAPTTAVEPLRLTWIVRVCVL
jgi:hypothetical protein